MSKQDMTSSRTPADLERKYLLNFGKSFAEVEGIALDARKTSEQTEEKLVEEVDKLYKHIEETAESITLSVSDVYATKDFVESELKVSAVSILAEVEGVYQTQDDATATTASLQAQIDENGASIASQAEMLTETNKSVASIEQRVTENEAEISLKASLEDLAETSASLLVEIEGNYADIQAQAELIDENTASIASIEQRVTENEANISLKASLDDVTGEFVISVINDESSAKISADRLDIEGQELNIKVDATNITGTLTAEQIDADGIVARGVDITGTITAEDGEIGGWTIGNDLTATTESKNMGIIQEQTVTFSARGVEATGKYKRDPSWTGPEPAFPSGVVVGQQYGPVFKTWAEILGVYDVGG